MKSWALHGEFLSWPQVGLAFWSAAGAAGAGFSFAAGAGSLAKDTGWMLVSDAPVVPVVARHAITNERTAAPTRRPFKLLVVAFLGRR